MLEDLSRKNTKKKYKYILFDLDGTLTYSHEGIYNCYFYALKNMGIPIPNNEQLKASVGPPLEYSFEHIFGVPNERVKEAVSLYRKRYDEKGWIENKPIPGALDALKVLFKRGYVLAIATSKPTIFAERIADFFGFKPYIDVISGCGTDGSFPTKQSVIDEAIRKLNANRELTLMVGDRKHDAIGARLCNIDFAGLNVGYGDKDELTEQHPDYLFSDFSQLISLLN